MVGKRRSGKAHTDVEAVLEGFPPPSLILPVREMESVLTLGQAAVPDLLSALSRWKEDEDRDLFPIVVLLGELGHADAVGPLVEILETPEDFFLREAAAEALARIGAPSVPLLKRLAREGVALERLFAFGALGEIAAEGTYPFLLEALEKDLELAGVISGGVASQGGTAAVPALVRALDRCPAWQRRELEANIRLAHDLEPRPTRLTEDWRLRYRVIPRLGTPRPGALVISAFLLESGEEMRELSSYPVRPLEEILADPPGEEPGLCEDCGKALESHTGIPVCPDDAVFVSFLQHRLLEEARDEYDEEDIFGLLEALETEALWLEDEDNLDYPGELEELEQEKEELEQEKEEVGIVLQTCRWLVEQGVEEVGAGRALLMALAGKLADRFGDPQGLLSSTRPGRSGFKPGRNDPCPCGSGKKYKKCCGKAEPANLRLVERRPVAETGPGGPDGPGGPGGPADEYEDPRGPESLLYDQLFTEVLRMARRSMARPEQEEALVRFLGPDFRGLSMESAVQRMDPMWAGECFFEWLVCDFRRRNGRTPLEGFVERKGPTLDARSQLLLERASLTFMSLYRIEEVRPGEGFTLKDLFLGERVEVEERLTTRQLVRWDLLATRLMEMDGAQRITGGIIPYPARDKDAVLEALEEEHVRFRAVHSGASKEEFLKEKGEVLYRIARQRLEAPLPSLLTSDGDPVTFCRARYHIREPEGLVGKMESIPGMEAQEGPEPFFRWVELLTEGDAPGPNADAQSAGSGESLVITSTLGSSRSLGSVEISEDRLVLECMSEARLARGRALLEEHLSGAINHRADTLQDPWQAMAERKEEGGPRERPTPEAIPPEVERGLYLDFMNQHYQGWVDEAVPALNGLTPREAVAAEGGRSRVAELIRQIEHGQIMHQREKGFAYDTDWLWEELGLDPAED